MHHAPQDLLASALAAASLSAFAADYYIVVPFTGKQTAVTNISVVLNATSLPIATVGTAYSYDFKNALSVTGDPAYSASLATFSTSSSLPAGMSLSSTGVLAGTPTVENPQGSSVQVLASYKSKTGQQAYTLVINGTVLKGVTQIATGSYHTCVLSFGGVKCWGYNGAGQLGDGTTDSSLTPVPVVGLSSGVTSLAAGTSHTCALTTSGGVKCWGNNMDGQVGDGSTDLRLTPVAVTGLSSGVVSLSAGGTHTCAVTSLGAAKCWGSNGYGRLGDGTSTTRRTPVGVVGLDTNVASISAGPYHTCAVLTTGTAKCWGWNLFGTVGDGSTTHRYTPVDVSGLGTTVARIYASSRHTCAITKVGGIKCWGYNAYGQLGDGSTTDRLTPVNVAGLGSGVSSMAGAWGSFTCALTNVGAKCWGLNDYDQLGDGTTNSRSTPVDVLDLGSSVVYLTGGLEYSCALLSSGAVKCWGSNSDGQLGNNSTTDSLVPVDVRP